MKKLIFIAILLILLLDGVSAAVTHDKPEIEAYVSSNLIPSGQVYPLQITVVNTAKYEWVERGEAEEEILYNISLNAYNVSIWLEGSDEIEVRSGIYRIPVLPSSGSQVLNFLISVPSKAAGKYILTLHVKYERIRAVEIYGNLSTSYEVDYFYWGEEKEIPIEIEIAEENIPVIKVIPIRSTYYENEVSQLVLQVVNEGTGSARNIEIEIEGIDVLDPAIAYISTLPPATSAPVSFTIKDEKGDYDVKAKINLSYYDGEKWIRAEQESRFKLCIDSLNKGIVISGGDNEFERDSKDFLDIYVMNSFSDPVSSLSLNFIEPEGVDLKIETLLLGYLNPGEVRTARIPLEIDEDANFGNREVGIEVKFRLLSSYPTDEQINSKLPVYIKPEPDFEAKTNEPVYVGENVVEVEILNKGGNARDIHAVIKPSPGILVKMPDAYIPELKSNEASKLSFRIDVDEDVIPGNIYRLKMEITSKDYSGEEITDEAYLYVRVESKPSYEYTLIMLIAAVLILIILKKKKR